MHLGCRPPSDKHLWVQGGGELYRLSLQKGKQEEEEEEVEVHLGEVLSLKVNQST